MKEEFWYFSIANFIIRTTLTKLVLTVIAFSFVNLMAASGIEELLVEWKVRRNHC